MLSVNIIYAFRLFIESIFCYSVYNYKNKEAFFQKYSIKKMAIFSSIYVISLFFYKYFLIDYTAYRLVSVLVIFAYFWIENKQIKRNSIKNFSYILTFSVFIVLMLECSHFLSCVINRFAWQWTGMYEFSETNLILDRVYRLVILILHSCFLFLVYKIRFIKMKDIKNLSVHKEIPILFGLCLLTVIYIKYHHQQFGINLYSSILAWVFMFLLPMYLGFYRHSCRLSRLINSNKNYIAKERIFNWIMNPTNNSKFLINVGDDVFAFFNKYQYVTSSFIKRLNALYINDSCRGYSSLVFCLFTASMLYGTKGWSCKKDIFEMTEKLLDLPKGAVRKDIGHIIKRTWALVPYETLEAEYYDACHIKNYQENNVCPSVEDFLKNMAKRDKMSLEELISNENSSDPTTRSGGLVSINGEGILITGSSGIGKSEAILDLIDKGHRLVADDLVELRTLNNSVYGNACAESKDFMEARGVGIVNVKRLVGSSAVTECERIDLVVNLSVCEEGKNEKIDRIGESLHYAKILGVKIPHINISVQPGRNIANIIKIAAMGNRQRFLGFISSHELYKRLGMKGSKIQEKVITEKELWGC